MIFRLVQGIFILTANVHKQKISFSLFAFHYKLFNQNWIVVAVVVVAVGPINTKFRNYNNLKINVSSINYRSIELTKINKQKYSK